MISYIPYEVQHLSRAVQKEGRRPDVEGGDGPECQSIVLSFGPLPVLKGRNMAGEVLQPSIRSEKIVKAETSYYRLSYNVKSWSDGFLPKDIGDQDSAFKD